jgi:hypothetical protein
MDFMIMVFLLAGLTMLSAAITGQSVTAIVQSFLGGQHAIK